MKKQITYKEPEAQFDGEGNHLPDIIREYTIIARSEEEMKAIDDSIRGDQSNRYKPIFDIGEWEDAPLNFEELQVLLSETDYKIIKSSEYQLAGLPMPYDVAALHAERETLREQIRQLEE